MTGKSLLLLGGGGHCRSVLDCILERETYERIGVVERERPAPAGPSATYVGTDEDLPALYADGWTSAFITLGSVGDSRRRRALYETVKSIGFELPAIISTTAIIGGNVEFEEGVFVGKRAVINIDTIVGTCAIINTAAILEHNCRVGAFAHISPGSILCGGVTIEADAHIGAGSVVRQQLNVGRGALIGAGSVVVCDMANDVIAYGNPCRVARIK